MVAPFNVAMRQLINKDNLWPPRKYPIEVHLLEDHTLVFNSPSRNLLQLRGQLGSTRSAVGFDYPDHNILAALMPADRLTQHVVRFADAGCVAEEKLEGSSHLLWCDLFQPFFRALQRRIRVIASAHKDKIKECSESLY